MEKGKDGYSIELQFVGESILIGANDKIGNRRPKSIYVMFFCDVFKANKYRIQTFLFYYFFFFFHKIYNINSTNL